MLQRLFGSYSEGGGDLDENEQRQVQATKDLLKKFIQPLLYRYGYGEYGELRQDEHLLDRTSTDFVRRIKRWTSLNPKSNALRYHTAALEEQLTDDIKQFVGSHLPAYEDAFLELDKRHSAQEVYLGRDGIFMYYARRAQLLARGDKTLGRITYLNYPRGIRDSSFTSAERLAYLRDAGIVDASKCVFIDTGYRGSIPKHIMALFDISEKDMLDRILLIKSTSEKEMQVPRRTRHTSDDVYHIENAPKPEDTAEGLYRDEKTGKIKTFSTPHDPQEILRFEVLKYLSMRHFYMQERHSQQIKQAA